MSDNKPTSNSFNDEIDLVQLLVQVTRIIRQNLKWLFLTITIGVIFGISGYFSFKSTYTTQMVAKSRWLTNVEVQALIQILNDLIEDENYEILTKKLKQSDKEIFKDVRSIEAISVWEMNDLQIPDFVRDSIFVVKLDIYDTKIVDSLEKGILHHLQNNDFVKTRVENYKKAKNEEIQKIEEEINELDSLQELINEAVAKNNQGFMVSPGEIYTEGIELYQSLLQAREDLQYADEFQIIEPFYIPQKPSSFNLIKSAIVGILSGVVLWVFLVIFLELRKVVIKAEQEEKSKVS